MANQKRITQLPIINALSGSANGASIIPVVVGGTTNQIIVERFSEFVNAYNATTSSNTFIGNQTISGSLVVTNDIRAERYYIETISSSVIYESGSTEFGNSIDDNHTFTGSLLVTGSVILNGTAVGIGQLNEQTASQDSLNNEIAQTTSSIHFTTQSLNIQTGSQDLVNLQISSTTGSINTTTSSFDSVFLQISSTTGSINITTSSFDSVFLQISSTTGSINTTTASFDEVFLGISSVTGAMNTQSSSQDLVNLQISSTTGSINTTTASFDSVFLGISSVTGAMNTQSSSQDLVNLQISSTTGSINTTTSSFDSVFFGISVVTSSIDAHILGVSQQTASQDGVNLGISTATGSLIGITNELMAFTASLDDSYATNEELYQLYQATRSLEIQTGSQDSVNLGISTFSGSIRDEVGGIEAYTASLKGAIEVSGQDVNVLGMITAQQFNVTLVSSSVMYQSGSTEFGDTADDIHTFTGTINLNGLALGTSELMAQTASQDSVNTGISAVTGAFATELGSIDAHILGVSTQTASQDGVNLGISIVTSSIDAHILDISTQTGSQDSVNFGISVVTSSIDAHILGVSDQTASQDGVNLGISTFTGSLRDEVDGIEAYTASLKGEAIVSSSQQIENYNLFAVTSSANTFYGNQTVNGTLNINAGSPARLYDSTNTNYWDLYHYTDNTLRLNYNGSGGDEVTLLSDGAINFSGNITGSGNISSTISSTDTTFGDVANMIVTNTATATTNQYSGIRFRFQDGTYNGNTFIGALRESGTSTGHSLIIAPSNTSGGNPSEGLRVNSSGNVSVNSVSNTAKFRVYNPTNDGTYSSKIQAVFGVNDYLDSDSTNIFGGGITETQFGNGATNRPAVISLGGNLNADEAIGVINFFSSTNDDNYRSRANIHASYVNTGTAGKYGGELRFSVAGDNVANPTETFRLEHDGDVKVMTGNLVIGTSGKGIDFSATSDAGGMTSELLDDYEEGTWTPVVRDAASAGNTASVSAVASYVKIGRLVTLQVSIGSIDTTGMTAGNIIYITGLPYTMASDNQTSTGACNFYNVAFGETAVAWINAAAGTDYIRILKQATGSTNSEMIVSDITSGTGEISFTISYHT